MIFLILYKLALRLAPRALRRRHFNEQVDLIRQMLREDAPSGLVESFAWKCVRLSQAGGSSIAAHIDRWRGLRLSRPWTGSAVMDQIRHDIHESVRTLWRNKASSVLTIGILVLGIAFTTVVCALLKSILLPLRPPAAEELVYIYDTGTHEFADFQATTTGVFAGVTAHAPIAAAIEAGQIREDEEWATGEVVGSNYFEVLKVSAFIGRVFSAAEDSDGTAGIPGVVISGSLWKRKFGSSASALGATLRLDGQPYVITGVAPPGFGGMREPWSPSQFWIVSSPRTVVFNPVTQFLIARMAPSLDVDRTRAALAALWHHAGGTRPRLVRTLAVQDVVAPFNPDFAGSVALKAAAGAATLAAIVLLIAITNVTGLLGIRAIRRTPELALKQCLGAAPGRLKRQLLGESLVLFLTAAFAGLLLAQMMMRAYASFAPVSYRGVAEIDWLVAMWVVGVCALAALIPPHVVFRPALGVSYRAILGGGSSDLVGDTRRRRRFTDAVLVTQVGMAILLLMLAGGNLQALTQLGFAPPGYDSQGVVIALVGPSDITEILALPVPERSRRTQAYYDRVLSRVKTVSQVESAAWASFLPASKTVAMRRFVATDGSGVPVSASQSAVSTEYFSTMSITVLEGRSFDRTDVTGTERPIVISASLANALWKDRSAVGRVLTPAGTGTGVVGGSGERMRIVGVVSDVRPPLEMEARPALYTWTGQMTIAPTLTLLVRSTGPPQPLARELKRLLRSDPGTVMTQTRLLVEEEGLRQETRRAIAVALVTAGGAGLFMAGAGILAALSYSLTRRRKELGIRLALGAQRSQILALVIRESFLILAVAAVPGIALGTLSLRVTASLGGAPPDLASIVAGTTIPLALMMTISVVIPALRAIRQLPIQSMRVS